MSFTRSLRQKVAQLTRAYSTQPYPFSSAATVVPSSSAPVPRTTSLMRTLNAHLTSQNPTSTTIIPLFSRRSPSRVLPGSILTVSSYTSPPSAANPSPPVNSFSGVLIAIRRRHAGRDTSIRLRNMVGRTGVEVAYKVFSPMIAGIKVVQRAETSGAPVNPDVPGGERRKPAVRADKRAKLYFVRDQPSRLAAVGGIVKQQREKELRADTRKGARR